MPDDFKITKTALDTLLRAKDGRASLYYLYMLANGDKPHAEVTAALGWSMAEFRAARTVLETVGLCEKATQDTVTAELTLPAYSTADITRSLEGDDAFSELIRYAQTRLSRVLATNDLGRLLGIYSHLGLSAGAVMLLISSCAESAERKSGKGARVGMWQIEREAYKWARTGITTETSAEQFVREIEAREMNLQRIAKLLGLSGKPITDTQAKYLERWEGMALPDEAIYAAYDKTVVNTGSLKWGYMDKILTDWKENGVPDSAAAPKPGRWNPPPQTASAGAHKMSATERRRQREQNGKNGE